MFDPENPKQKPILSIGAKPNLSPTPIAIPMTDKDRLRFYLINCSGTRKYYGFGMDENKKLTIADKDRLRSLPEGDVKTALRELYDELK